MPPYAVRCGWCGRSTTVSAFLQVLSITVVIVGALVVAGVVPMSTLRKYVPGLGSGTEAGLVASADQSPPADVSPAPPGSPAAARAASRGVEGSRGREDVRSSRRAVEPSSRLPLAGPETQALIDSGAGCDAPSRVDALAARHPDWARESAVLVSCGKIALGFTSDQVIAAKGRPRQIERPQGASQVEEWVYRAQRVVLEQGRVVSVRK
jgi:hypothetical protein